jgi:hypothetical protein
MALIDLSGLSINQAGSSFWLSEDIWQDILGICGSRNSSTSLGPVTFSATQQVMTCGFQNFLLRFEGDFTVNGSGAVTGGTVQKIDYQSSSTRSDWGLSSGRLALSGLRLPLVIGPDGYIQTERWDSGDPDVGGPGNYRNSGFQLAGNDAIIGSMYEDIIYGWNGDDVIDCGLDNKESFWQDFAWGGAGADTFVVPRTGMGQLVISDFSIADGDRIDVPGKSKGYRWKYVNAQSPELNGQGGGYTSWVGWSLCKGNKAYANLGIGYTDWTPKTLKKVVII